MKSLLLLASVGVIFSTATTTFETEFHPLSDEFINEINANQSLWKAGRNFREDTPISYLRNLLGRRISDKQPEHPELRHNLADVEIPDSFDWRDQSPSCVTIRDIRDQGSCGSCWAFATVEVISDRICIHSEGNLNVYISADDLVSCCGRCGAGCRGGNEHWALQYWVDTGIVSGGPYGSDQGCRPYEIPPCEHIIDIVNPTRPPCSFNPRPTPECKNACQSGYSKSYKEDLHFGKSAYTIPNDVQQIQAEIMINGPVTAAFTVYDDLFHYKTGVYKHTKGTEDGGHAVKIIGWGVENDTPYWLIANSWNTDFGELGGFFKFLRGENHCGIEQNIAAGIPA